MAKKKGRFGWLEIPGKGKGIPVEGEEKDADSYLESGEGNYYEGFYELALRDYSRALQYDKGLISAWMGQVKCLLELDELDEAETWINNALSYFPESADLLAAKAVVLCNLGKREEALSFSDNSFDHQSRSGYPWIVRGYILLSLHRRKTGNRCLERIISENPEDWRIHLEVGKVFFRHRNFSKALYYFNKAVQKNPSNAFIWLEMARCYQGMHLRAKVRFCCERALEIRPSFPEVVELLGEYHRKPCFIATACFQNQADEVVILRKWRDDYLEHYFGGRLFLCMYYRIGYVLAKPITRFASLHTIIRFCLKCFTHIFIRRRTNGN